MTDEHTPGPWCAPQATTNNIRIEGGTVYKIRHREDDTTPIVFVSGLDNDDPGEGFANARLIAAAPELLEALELVVKRCGSKSTDGALARAAIAKARGQRDG